MLAPLEDRSILERDPGDPQGDLAPPVDEIARLQAALRRSRRARRQDALRNAGDIAGLQNEIDRLCCLNAELEARLADYAAAAAIVELASQLVRCNADSQPAHRAAHRAWQLEKAILCARLACRRTPR